MKDQTKKVASLKHKEQVEKSRNARLMDEARKREDNLSESSQQVKVRPSVRILLSVYNLQKASAAGWGQSLKKQISAVVKDTLRQKSERIEELEEALRESVQITAEREVVLAQEEAARSLQEKRVQNIHACTTKQCESINKARYYSTSILNLSVYRHRNSNLSLAAVVVLLILSVSCLLFLLATSFFFFGSPSVSLSLLVVFSCLSASQPPFRSTHSNQCMSPTSPTLSGLRYESSVCNPHQRPAVH